MTELPVLVGSLQFSTLISVAGIFVNYRLDLRSAGDSQQRVKHPISEMLKAVDGTRSFSSGGGQQAGVVGCRRRDFLAQLCIGSSALDNTDLGRYAWHDSLL